MGVELTLGWQLATQWRLDFEGTYARHRYDNAITLTGMAPDADIDGNDIDTAPRRFHAMQLGWTPRPETLMELEWVSMGSYYLEPTNEFKYPGHDLLHLRVKQQLTPKISAALRVHNLLDEDYADRGDYAFGEYRYFIGDPRAIFIELGLDF